MLVDRADWEAKQHELKHEGIDIVAVNDLAVMRAGQRAELLARGSCECDTRFGQDAVVPDSFRLRSEIL